MVLFQAREDGSLDLSDSNEVERSQIWDTRGKESQQDFYKESKSSSRSLA